MILSLKRNNEKIVMMVTLIQTMDVICVSYLQRKLSAEMDKSKALTTMVKTNNVMEPPIVMMIVS